MWLSLDVFWRSLQDSLRTRCGAVEGWHQSSCPEWLEWVLLGQEGQGKCGDRGLVCFLGSVGSG